MLRRVVIHLTLSALAALMPSLAHAWWSKDWTARTQFTLNTGATGVSTREAINGFLVPLRLHSGNFDFASAKEDGSDLRVVAGDDKTPLPFFVERFDGINELALVWVSVPTLAPNSDQNKVFLYAGNPKAAAEAPGKPFNGDALLLAQFAEADGPAVDAVGGARGTQAVVRDANGLLGGSAKLAGQEVTWPASDRARLTAGGSATVSMWIKPESVASGSLLRWGPLRMALAGGQLAAEVGATKLAGGNLPAGGWAQVALTVGGGKATLYVNGAQAARADATLPAVDGPVGIGSGYAGLVDQMLIENTARGPESMKLMAASQGADGKLVTSTRETSASESGESPGYLGILLKNLTTDAWVVIGILMVMFVIAVWVMITKTIFVQRMDRDNHGFMKRFRAAADEFLDIQAHATQPNSSLYRLYAAGVVELKKRKVGVTPVLLSGASIDAVKAAIDADMVRESYALNAQMVLLTIAISGGPFLGLLGTVVGVMITFAAIAAAGDVNVNAIAPGIAAALLATVAGLAVAIPALFGYNYLASRIKNISSDMQIFVDEFVTRVAEIHGQR